MNLVDKSAGEAAGNRDGGFDRSRFARRRDQFLTGAAFALVLAVVLGAGTDHLWPNKASGNVDDQRTAMLSQTSGRQ